MPSTRLVEKSGWVNRWVDKTKGNPKSNFQDNSRKRDNQHLGFRRFQWVIASTPFVESHFQTFFPIPASRPALVGVQGRRGPPPNLAKPPCMWAPHHAWVPHHVFGFATMCFDQRYQVYRFNSFQSSFSQCKQSQKQRWWTGHSLKTLSHKIGHGTTLGRPFQGLRVPTKFLQVSGYRF